MSNNLARRPNLRSRVACAVALALVLAFEAVGCAGNLFGRGRPSREEAIAHCIEMIPAESALYADHFSACMEQQGWVYAPSGS